LLIEIFDSHEKDAFIDSFWGGSSFTAKFWRPKGTIIIVVADVAFEAPRIANFDQSVAIRKLNCSKDYVSVSILKLAGVQEGARDHFSVEEHHFISDVML